MTLCFRQKDQWANDVYVEGRSHFQECAETQKCNARPKKLFLFLLKLAVCTPTVRVFNGNYSSLQLQCLK